MKPSIGTKNINTGNTEILDIYNAGDFLYDMNKFPDDKRNEFMKVFIHDGYLTGDGYGVMSGFNSNGKLRKSHGFGNFCCGKNVRKATQEEIIGFIKEVYKYYI